MLQQANKMRTLRITVDSDSNSLLLIKMLKSISFVTKVETDEIPKNSNDGKTQFDNLKNILDAIENNRIFEDIKDPVEWQKQLRNEWK